MDEIPNINYAATYLMVDELVRSGVTFFCIAPGSRSSPLTIAAARHPKTQTVIHYDERGLAFYALGYVSATRKPAVLICSSGTAVANFFPAVVETSKKKLPLILLTADRPTELQNTGALQTIDQDKIFGSYIRWQMTLPPPDMHVKPEVLLTTIDQAVFMSKNPMPGPVHINCQFREPLAPEPSDFNPAKYLESLQSHLNTNEPFTRYTTGEIKSDISSDNQLISIIDNTKRGIIAVGKLSSKEEQNAVLSLSDKLQWPIFPDIVSGLRSFPHPNIIHYYDQLLSSGETCYQFPIDTVIHIGGRITSKRFYQYIETIKPRNYITVLGHSLRNDPMHIVTIRIKSKVTDFINSILPTIHPKTESDYLEFFRTASQKTGEIIDDFLSRQNMINEPAIARTISRLIPDHSGLFLSNSMPVRDMDMFAGIHNKNIETGGNRGASGIDGIIASACGFARGLNIPTTLLIGDLAFLHDLNSLFLTNTISHLFVIVVINNNGGGIFSFLPIASTTSISDIFDPLFGTPHGLEFSNAAKMFGLHYENPKNINDFENAYSQAIISKRSTIIEINTDRNDNIRLHRELLKIYASGRQNPF